MILALVVARRVLVVAHVVGGLLVAEHGDRREELALAGQHGAFDGGVKGRGIDKRLEDGAGGPLGHRVVQLDVAVAAAAHQRKHLAGVGIERDERDLRIDVWLCPASCRCACSLSTCSSTTWIVDSTAGGFSLQVGIERGVDAQAFAVEVALAELLQ